MQEQNLKKNKGQLTIFFGYAEAVGKTYQMLQNAREQQNLGRHVMIGYIESQGREDIIELANEFCIVPYLTQEYNGVPIQDFNLDETLKLSPDIVLIDDLAHDNIYGSRHAKRFNEVSELLDNGIDVYTTLNIQNIESLHDTVSSITGMIIHSRIPDSVFDNADEVIFVDIAPEKLIERIETGNIFPKIHAQQLLNSYFSMTKLTALREIALRRTSDRIQRLADISEMPTEDNYYTQEHILVCLSASSSNAKVIRNAARLAFAFQARLTALYVEDPNNKRLNEKALKTLKQNMSLAEQFGAHIETITGEDIAYQISEYARLSRVSKVVLGRSSAKNGLFHSKLTIVEQLAMESPYLDIYIIPVKTKSIFLSQKKDYKRENKRDLIYTIFVLLITTIIAFFLQINHISSTDVTLLFIASVMIVSMITSDRIYSIIASISSVILFNLIFVEPLFSFKIENITYLVTFAIMFLTSILMSTFANKMKKNEKISALSAYRMKILLDTNQLIRKENTKEGIIKVTCQQLLSFLEKPILFFEIEEGVLQDPLLYDNENNGTKIEMNENEIEVAQWVLKNNKQAGTSTDTFSKSKYYYLTTRVNQDVYGVVGIDLQRQNLEPTERSILYSILGEMGLALESEKVLREKNEAHLIAKNEKLRANFLRSVSHDLRTPLTSIAGNAGILLSNAEKLDDKTKNELYKYIQNDAMWLINLVENILSVTRIEDGTMKVNRKAEMLSDILDEALTHIYNPGQAHKIIKVQEDEFLFVKVDVRLIMQVVVNIVDNAIKYTEPPSTIYVEAYEDDHSVVIDIKDSGKGVKDSEKERIFDMFYTGEHKVADGRRSMGLGLALCKSIVEAHEGSLEVLDNKPTGSIFRIILPKEEVQIYE